MITELLKQLINNFEMQAQLYSKMEELSRIQLEHLKDSSYSACLDEVGRILAERKAIITEITQLNDKNKQLQQQVVSELEIECFNIKNLKGKVPEDEFAQLKTAVNKVQKLLTLIDKTDRESESIMRRSVPGKSTATYKQAAQAYKQP